MSNADTRQKNKPYNKVVDTSHLINGKDIISLGIVIGGGTGELLANIFSDCMNFFAEFKGKKINLLKTPKPYFSSYNDILKYPDTKEQSKKEATELFEIYRLWFEELKIEHIFRTSINAEALYIFRQMSKAMKKTVIMTDHEDHILFFREQSEGFYANTEYNVEEEIITFKGQYSKQTTQEQIKFAIEMADNAFGKDNYLKCALFKYHLFGDKIEKWIKEIDPLFNVLQPDTGLTKTLDYLKEKRGKDLLLFTSNEVGDLMYEPIIETMHSTVDKLDLFSESIFYSKPFFGQLKEFQTVHGSADDLINESRENEIVPFCTFRIASAIAEESLKVDNAKWIMDRIIGEARVEFIEGINTQSACDFIFNKMKIYFSK